jgi:hypothetical protein
LAWAKVSHQKIEYTKRETNHFKLSLESGFDEGLFNCLVDAFVDKSLDLGVDSFEHVVSDGVLRCGDRSIFEGQPSDDHTGKTQNKPSRVWR